MTLAQQHIRMLLEYAEQTGVVPTTRDAMTILGVGRTWAGSLLHAAFGRDERRGADRRGPRMFTHAPISSGTGPLSPSVFDAIETLSLLGWTTTASAYGERIGVRRETAAKHLKALHDEGLLDRVEHVSMHEEGNPVRFVHYTVNRTGRRKLAEAFAAIDAACKEAA